MVAEPPTRPQPARMNRTTAPTKDWNHRRVQTNVDSGADALPAVADIRVYLCSSVVSNS
jgi:hypothetical protein